MNELTGIDYEWLLLDAEGELAIMVNAGEGPVPTSILSPATAPSHLYDLISSLPVQSEVVVQATDAFVSERYLRDFTIFSQRGFYSYDWPDVHRTQGALSKKYELMTSPTVPLLVGQLPDPLKHLQRLKPLAGASFKTSPYLDISVLFDCKYPES